MSWPNDLGAAVRRPRVERCEFGLRRLADLAEHLRRAGLVEADRVVLGSADDADGLEHAQHARSVHVGGQLRLVERQRHERDRCRGCTPRRVGGHQHGDQAGQVAQVAVDQFDVWVLALDQLGLRVVLPVIRPIDRVALRVKKLGEESPVLARDPGDERGGHPGEVTELRIGTVMPLPESCPRAARARRYTLAGMSLRSAVAHRNLLYLLSLKELRTRYKKSILGWAWSLLNPLTQMLIFSVIFL